MFVKVNKDAREEVHQAVDDLNCHAFRQQAALFVLKCIQTGRVLAVKRFKDNQIGLPCGKIDAGETPIEAAHRELYEETGVHQSTLQGPTRYLSTILFDGTLVHIFQSYIGSEGVVGAAKGFEEETLPQWFDVEDLVAIESRFKSFNIVALHKAGLY